MLAQQGYNPRWSPDGRQVAFHRTVDPSEYFFDRPCTARIWVVDADGANERRLDDLGDGCDAPPLWSPDGTRLSATLIASTAAEPDLGMHLGIITVDGSSPTVILVDGPSVSWQPVAALLPPAPSFPAESATPYGRREPANMTPARRRGHRAHATYPHHVTVDHDSRARTHLANERTFLAWFRTGITLVALGLAAAQFLGSDTPGGPPLIHILATLVIS